MFLKKKSNMSLPRLICSFFGMFEVKIVIKNIIYRSGGFVSTSKTQPSHGCQRSIWLSLFPHEGRTIGGHIMYLSCNLVVKSIKRVEFIAKGVDQDIHRQQVINSFVK